MLTPDENGNFSYVMHDWIDDDAWANRYFFATYYPRAYYSPPANIYICTMLDKDGRKIDGGRMYKLKIPEDMPVKQGVLELLLSREFDRSGSTVELLVGIRWRDNRMSVTINPAILPGSISASASESWVDPVIGLVFSF